MIALAFPICAVLAIAWILLWRFLSGKRLPDYLAVTEYWVYIEGEKIPDQTAMMERVLRGNPHNRPNDPAITSREGLLFSDIRLHLGLAKRAKNPHIFRPDIIDENAVPRKNVLEGLAKAKAMIKVRYLSEAKLVDTRHLRFLPHVTDAISQMGEGTVVFDHVLEVFWTADEFHKLMQKTKDCERPDFHVRVVWKADENGYHAETLGLRKVGRQELRTEPQEEDLEVLVSGLLLNAAYKLMRNPDETGPFTLEEYGDEFTLSLDAKARGHQKVLIQRRKVVS